MKIVVCTASRSERGLTLPLINELKRSGKFDVEVLELPVSFKGALEIAEEYLRVKEKPDLVFCSYDRVEMLGACLVFYFNGVKIAQYHAGDFGAGEGVFDDCVRFMITLCSDIQFCNSAKSFTRCLRFLRTAGKPVEHCYCVGSLAFDDVNLDYSVVPNEPFDLILYNPLPKRLDLMGEELNQVENLLGERLAIWIYPNEDVGRDIVIKRIKKLEREGKVIGYDTLPRPQFLALLEKAERVIGNSSSFFYELPYFGKSHIHIGVRNRERERIEIKTGASKKIVKILEKLFCNSSGDKVY